MQWKHRTDSMLSSPGHIPYDLSSEEVEGILPVRQGSGQSLLNVADILIV